MQFLLDENVNRHIANMLSDYGHSIVWVPRGISDNEVYDYANEKMLILVTNDTDFLDVAAYPAKNTPGRIVLRIFPTVFVHQENVFRNAVQILNSSIISEKVITISSQNIVSTE